MIQLSIDKPLNIEFLKDWFKINGNLNVNWVMREKCKFYNCVVLCCDNGTGKIAIKIFRNGNLHITGAKTIQIAYNHASVISDMLMKYDKNIVQSSNAYNIINYKIQLMNGCMKIIIEEGKGICLKTLFTILSQDTNHFCIFNNDHHPGIRMKFKHTSGRRSSIMIFQRGSILFNAVLSGDELFESYSYITTFINTHFTDVVKASVKKITKSKTKFDYSMYIK
jgi:TATA-box binding protein (TBP) (component of TFIID and TFIIIB)